MADDYMSASAGEVQELSSDYAAYAKVNLDFEFKGIRDAIEEMQLRLEEFSSILVMIQSKGEKSVIDNFPTVHAIQPKVMSLCKKIEALDLFITKANLDLATLEANMEIADSSIGSIDKKLAMLNPFSYFKKSLDGSSASGNQPLYQPPNIYKTEDYFRDS